MCVIRSQKTIIRLIYVNLDIIWTIYYIKLTLIYLYAILWIPLEDITLPNVLEHINWIDIVFIILLLGMVYKGMKTGVGGQILSLIGSIALIFLSIGYYSLLSEAIFGFLLQAWAKPLSFLLIMLVIITLVKVLERVFNIINGEELSMIERVGGALVAAFRAVITCGLIGIMFLLTPVDYLHRSVSEGSKFGMHIINMDAQIYSWMTELIQTSGKKDKEEVLQEILTSTQKGAK